MSTIAHTDHLTLDLSAAPQKRSEVTVYAKQDDNARRIWIEIRENGEDYQIPDGVRILLRALKPDGRFVLSEAPYEGCNVYLTFPREMLTCIGCVRAEISLLYEEEILTSANFYVEVLPHALADIESGSELSAISTALEAATALTKQAMVPVPAETVYFADGYTLSASSIRFHSEAPVWETDHFTFTDSGSSYSSAEAAYDSSRRYFFDSDDHTAYCKLVGNGSNSTGFTRFRPLIANSGMTKELRALLDGQSVEERALPTTADVAALQELRTKRYITANSTSYHLIENMTAAVLSYWVDLLVNHLAYGEAIDLGDGVRRRFVTEAELDAIHRRLTTLEKA